MLSADIILELQQIGFILWMISMIGVGVCLLMKYGPGSRWVPVPIPKRNHWSKKKPTEPGWYWFKRGHGLPITIVEIPKQMFGDLDITFTGSEHVTPLDEVDPECEWIKINEPI